MRRHIFSLAALLGALLPAAAQPTDYVIDAKKDSAAFAKAEWNWHSIGRDIEAGYAQFEIFDSHQSISVVRYKASSHRSEIFHCPGERRSVTSATGSSNRALAALNGSYFNVKTLYPTTLVVDGRKVCGHSEPQELYRVNGLLRIRGRRVDVVECADTNGYASATRRCREALASGPVLIDDGEVKCYDSELSFYRYRHPRTMVGVSRDNWVYMVVVDGRFPGRGEGASIAEMAFLAGCFGLCDAINLDGGGSCALWNHEDGVLSHPYDNRRFDHEGEREVPNVLLVY